MLNTKNNLSKIFDNKLGNTKKNHWKILKSKKDRDSMLKKFEILNSS